MVCHVMEEENFLPLELLGVIDAVEVSARRSIFHVLFMFILLSRSISV